MQNYKIEDNINFFDELNKIEDLIIIKIYAY